ncbi:MAG: hypothetical protein PWP48_1350 [Clostridiales bacterium]|nr:hypothetical protein [Clostridiales bacterium]
MKNIYDKRYLLTYIIVTVLMVLCLNLSITNGFDFPYPFYKTIIWTVIITLLFSLWAFYKKIDIIVLAAFIAIIVAVYIRDKQELISAADFVKNMAIWASLYMNNSVEYSAAYAQILLFCIYILTGFIMPFLIIRWKQTFIPIVAGLLIFVVQWYGFVDEAIYYMVVFAAVAVVLMALRTYERQQRVKSKDALSNWVSMGGIISAAAIAMTMIMPMDIEPVSWQWLNDKIVQTFPVVREWRGGDRAHPLTSVDLSGTFDLSETGMQRSQKFLGGPALQDDSVALIVHSPQKTYLRAVAYDIYDGRGWERSQSKWYAYNDGAAMDNSFARDVETYKIKITVEPADLHSNTLFVPWQPWAIYKQDGGQYYGSDAYEIMNPEGRMREPYTAESIVPIVDVDRLKASGYNYPLPIMNRYLQLPQDRISDRLKQEAMKITEKYSNPYDKVKAVESYLRQFPYTLDVSYTPRGQEFVDYFIFEQKQGYCVYYATAMAVMLRSIGIPARYVTGFVMPDEPVESDRYEVTNSQAHSWVEVYFSEFGWLPFEPTPAYAASQFGETITGDAVAAGNYNDYYQQYMDYMNQLNQTPNNYDPSAQIDVVAPAEPPETNWWPTVLWSAAALIAALLMRITYVWIIKWRQRNVWRRSEYREGILTYYDTICRLLEHWGLSMWPGETPAEYADRVCRYMGSQRFKELTDIFQRARYSQQSMTKAELEQMSEYYERILESIREQPKTYMRYIWRRYVLNAI